VNVNQTNLQNIKKDDFSSTILNSFRASGKNDNIQNINMRQIILNKITRKPKNLINEGSMFNSTREFK
jgi:hypothetical protein